MFARFIFFGVGLALLVGAPRVSAHHAFSAEFDADRPLELHGTVSKTEWINPHSWIHVDVEGEDGITGSQAQTDVAETNPEAVQADKATTAPPPEPHS